LHRRERAADPLDIEREFRITGGHWHHAELALDQFFMLRPVPGASQYQAPVPGCSCAVPAATPAGA